MHIEMQVAEVDHGETVESRWQTRNVEVIMPDGNIQGIASPTPVQQAQP
jgi:hypothetical protein